MKNSLIVIAMMLSSSAWSLSMNLEGSCSGKLQDGTPVSFQYYSNYNGCRKVSRAAISFHEGRDEMVTGKRTFTRRSDIFTFGKIKLVFANSTGNTFGNYHYTDQRADRQRVKLQCEVRDYEYADC